MSLVDATRESVRAARAANRLSDADAGAVEALMALARKIDAWDVIVEWALDECREGSRPKVPANDNVSLATYLRGCELLGLTPSARTKVGPGVSDARTKSRTDELRERRAAKAG